MRRNETKRGPTLRVIESPRGKAEASPKTSADRPGYKRGAETRKRILLAAEKLFAERGVDGASLREITDEAGADLALVKYYFGGKDGLFEAVLGERFLTLTDACEKRIAALPARATIDDLVEAILAPPHEYLASGDPGWRHYSRIVTQKVNLKRFRNFSRFHLNRSARSFMEAIARIAPSADERLYYWCHHFACAALADVLTQSDRLEILSGGKCDLEDHDEAFAKLHTFVAGGMRAVLKSGHVSKYKTNAPKRAQAGKR